MRLNEGNLLVGGGQAVLWGGCRVTAPPRLPDAHPGARRRRRRRRRRWW
jgi:hypothetical protein